MQTRVEKSLTLIKSENFGNVRCDFYQSEDEFFMTREQIGRALEYSEPRIAIMKIHERHKERLDKFSVVTKVTTTDGKSYDTYLYTAKGVYEICRWSQQPNANEFYDWVYEMLEGLRTGKFTLTRFNIPKTYPEALRLAADLAEENERLKPKAEAHDVFLMGVNSQAMDKVSKSLNGIGRNKLFAFLRANKILRYDNTPYQKYIDAGYFKIRQTSTTRGDKVFNVSQTLVTAKGHDFIYRLLKQVGIENVKQTKLKEIKEGRFLIQAINGF